MRFLDSLNTCNTRTHVSVKLQGIILPRLLSHIIAAKMASASTYSAPLRYIFDLSDHQQFIKSSTCEELLKFIAALNSAVADKSQSASAPLSPRVECVLNALKELAQWVDEIPPIKQPMRYGNKAYRDWHSRLVARAVSMCETIAASAEQPRPGVAVELAPYLCDAFGNATRIDYGTGHETTFVIFLYHKHIRPKSIHNADVLEGFSKDYMYLAAIQFINEVKFGAPFAEHSPILNDISELPTWARVNEGLAKMYKTELLGKLPVVQHFLFGSLFPATWTPSRPPVPPEPGATSSGSGSAASAASATTATGAAGGEVPVPIDHGVSAVAPWITEPMPLPPVRSPVAVATSGPSGSGGNSPVSPASAIKHGATRPPGSPANGGGATAASHVRRASGSGSSLSPGGDIDMGREAGVATERPTVVNMLEAFGEIPHISPAYQPPLVPEEREARRSRERSTSESSGASKH